MYRDPNEHYTPEKDRRYNSNDRDTDRNANFKFHRTARHIKKNALAVDLRHLIDPHHTRENQITTKPTDWNKGRH
jgi:hypothetical protein